MIKLVGSGSRQIKMLERCWLRDVVSGYLEQRASLGYRPSTLRSDQQILLRFAAFMQDGGQCSIAAIPQWIDRFADQCKNRLTRNGIRYTLLRFAKHLQVTGQLPQRDPGMPAPRFFKYVSAYERYLREQRGLAETSIAAKTAYCIKFMHNIYAAGVRKMSYLRRSAIEQFIKDEAQNSTRNSVVAHCSIIRNFLRYLYGSGQARVDFSSAVMVPQVYRHERSPRFLTAAEIQAVLRAAHVNTALGRRNYAILLTLATYGLRGAEVAHLCLEDIRWRTDTICVRRRKAGGNSLFPLTPAVGEAIAAYLEHGRPKSRRREVFLWGNAPFRPISTYAIAHVVRKHLGKAGLSAKCAGAHTFRYTCAQRMFEQNLPLKVIGDFLGHRNLDTTMRYTKIDLPNLRGVALNDGEDML